MDWSLPVKCCTLAIASVTLGLSVTYLKRSSSQPSVPKEVEMAAVAQPVSNTVSNIDNIVASMEQVKISAKEENQVSAKEENQVSAKEENHISAKEENHISAKEENHISAKEENHEQVPEIEIPDRDSANHSPSDFLSANLNSDTQSESSNDSGKGGSDCANTNADNVRFDVITPPFSPTHISLAPLPERLFVYEFEIPQNLCGLLIGRYGAYVTHIKTKTGASLFIKEQTRRNRLQLCAVEGTKTEIDAALALIRAKFPLKKYPNLTLAQINITLESAIPVLPDSIQLHLPQEVSCDVVISAVVAPNHVFIQQITHPTYSSLARLDACMTQCYSDLVAPGLPQPIQPNMICAAPSVGGWFRAKVVAVYEPVSVTNLTNVSENITEPSSSDVTASVEEEENKGPVADEMDYEVDICFVDYGGYSRVLASCLRQVRADFMSLPFQAVECLLANVAPKNAEEGWNMDACTELENLTNERVLQAQTVAFSLEGLPLIYLYHMTNQTEVQLINRQLVENGGAQWVEPQVVSN